MTGLWEKLVNRFRHARYRQQQKTLPQTIWLHLVAALEESGKGMALRPNLYQVMIPASDYDLLRPLIADLEVELAGRLATEALKRGYHLTGAAGVKIVVGTVNTMRVKTQHVSEAPAEADNDTTVIFRLSKRKKQSSLPSRQMVVLTGPDRGSIFTLWGTEVLIGRSETNHIVLHDEGVSRVHLRISWTDNEEYIEDLGSLNGTWVNGCPVLGQRRLEEGDKITLGSTTLEYRG